MSQRTLQRARREFADVRHPLQPGLCVERVIVGPSGIHVVTTVPAAGAPGASLVDRALVAGARATADVVASLLPARYHPRVRAVLVLTGAEPLAEHIGDVLVTTSQTLEHIMRSSLVVLSTSEVHDVGLRLAAGLEAYPVEAPVRRTLRSRRRTLLVAAGAATCAGAVVLLERTGTIAHLW